MNKLKPESPLSLLEEANGEDIIEVRNVESEEEFDPQEAIEEENGILRKFKGFTGRIAKILTLVTSLSFIPGDQSLDQRPEMDNKNGESSAKMTYLSPEDEDYLKKMENTFVLTGKVTSSTIREVGNFAKEEIAKAKWEIWAEIYKKIFAKFDSGDLFKGRYDIFKAVDDGFNKYKDELQDGSGFILENKDGDEKEIIIIKKENKQEIELQDERDNINNEDLSQMAREGFLPQVEDKILPNKLDEVWSKIPDYELRDIDNSYSLEELFLTHFNAYMENYLKNEDLSDEEINEEVDKVVDIIIKEMLPPPK